MRNEARLKCLRQHAIMGTAPAFFPQCWPWLVNGYIDGIPPQIWACLISSVSAVDALDLGRRLEAVSTPARPRTWEWVSIIGKGGITSHGVRGSGNAVRKCNVLHAIASLIQIQENGATLADSSEAFIENRKSASCWLESLFNRMVSRPVSCLYISTS